VPRPHLRRLVLTKELDPEQVSLAWEFLSNLQPPSILNPEPEWPEPPESLQHLTDADWFLLDNLLARELKLKELSPLQ
jgi:hypothetical protein